MLRLSTGHTLIVYVAHRFVQEPLKDMLSQMDKREKGLNEDVASLNKKLTVRRLFSCLFCCSAREADLPSMYCVTVS